MKPVNLYHGATNAQRKKIDQDLKARMQPCMVYQTSYIVTGVGFVPPMVTQLKKPPHNWRMA